METKATHETPVKTGILRRLIKNILFESKWLLVIFYIGLIFAQTAYCIKFCQMVWELGVHFWTMTESELMLVILTLVDVTMVANLIKMIVTGSYLTFVDKQLDDSGMEKVSSGLLKVKMGSSLVGVSSIHLLQTFIDAPRFTDRDVIVKCAIHVIFLVSTIGLAYIDYLHGKTEKSIH